MRSTPRFVAVTLTTETNNKPKQKTLFLFTIFRTIFFSSLIQSSDFISWRMTSQTWGIKLVIISWFYSHFLRFIAPRQTHIRHGKLLQALPSIAKNRVSWCAKIENFLYFLHTRECRSIPILILGLKESGKTEIAFRLTGRKRDEFLSTKGCRMFATKFEKQLIKLTELGGEEFYDIWKYYFLDVSKMLPKQEEKVWGGQWVAWLIFEWFFFISGNLLWWTFQLNFIFIFILKKLKKILISWHKR